jgi:hypothetical protein
MPDSHASVDLTEFEPKFSLRPKSKSRKLHCYEIIILPFKLRWFFLESRPRVESV